MNVRLYILQRATAAIMVPLVLGHLAVIYYATSRGLSAADILGRTQGSIGWGAYYALFVLVASVHGAIGVRVVASEWTVLRGRQLDAFALGVGVVLAGLGLRAVAAVVLP
jgi:fumarate reductase subunit C